MAPRQMFCCVRLKGNVAAIEKEEGKGSQLPLAGRADGAIFEGSSVDMTICGRAIMYWQTSCRSVEKHPAMTPQLRAQARLP